MHTVFAMTLSLFCALALPAMAQAVDVVTDVPETGPVTDMGPETPGEGLSVDLWRADPLKVFRAADIELGDFLWIARPVVVFADTDNDPAYRDQMRLLLARPDALSVRDVVLIVDTEPQARSDLRLKLRPRGFQLALLGKDGQVKLRKPLPWDVRELTRVIDKMPMRERETMSTPLSQ